MKSSRADAASQEENSTDEFKVSLHVQNPLSMHYMAVDDTVPLFTLSIIAPIPLTSVSRYCSSHYLL